MSRMYLMTVRTYMSVNNMGLELGRYVEETFDHMLVSAADLRKVVANIDAKMKALEAQFPRSRPFKREIIVTKDKFGVGHESIYVTPQSKYNDNHVFVLDTEVVRGELKGGDL